MVGVNDELGGHIAITPAVCEDVEGVLAEVAAVYVKVIRYVLYQRKASNLQPDSPIPPKGISWTRR